MTDDGPDTEGDAEGATSGATRSVADGAADARGASGGARAAGPVWGAWETAAATAVFSVPGAMVLTSGWGPGARVVRGEAGRFVTATPFTAGDWGVVGVGIAAALALTLAARGVSAARSFLTAGLFAGVAWILSDWLVIRAGALEAVYKPLVFVALAAHYNLAPVALFAAWRQLTGRVPHVPEIPEVPEIPGDARARIRRRIWAVAGSAAALDLAPVVYLLAPGRSGKALALAWAIACVLVGGGLAASAAAEIAKHAPREEA